METSSPTAFHCPSCGTLTQASPGEAGQVVCRACGYEFRKPIRVSPRGGGTRAPGGGKLVQRDVVSRRRVESREPIAPPSEAPPAAEPAPAEAFDPSHVKEEVLEDGTRKVMKRRRVKRRDPKRQLMMLGFALLLVAFTVLTVREFVAMDHAPVLEDEGEKEKRIAATKKAQIDAYVQEHIGACYETLKGYFDETSAETRVQFVNEPMRVASRMHTYYTNNLLERSGRELTLERSGLRLMGEVPAIETVWMTESGKTLEVAFVRSGGRWLIDWEEFVRYGTMPWQLFMTGTDGLTGEFRLYVRRRKLISEDEDLLGLQFYQPGDSSERRPRGQSPRVVVRKDSAEGEFLEAVLQAEPSELVAGDSFFAERDPEGMERLRIVLEWQEAGDGESVLMVKEVRADHWWGDGFEDTGDGGDSFDAAPEALPDGAIPDESE